MGEETCPMCGQSIRWDAPERMCAYCHMLLPVDAPYYVVHRQARTAHVCSPGCVRGFLAFEAAGLPGLGT